jgi:hypothetical protein
MTGDQGLTDVVPFVCLLFLAWLAIAGQARSASTLSSHAGCVSDGCPRQSSRARALGRLRPERASGHLASPRGDPRERMARRGLTLGRALALSLGGLALAVALLLGLLLGAGATRSCASSNACGHGEPRRRGPGQPGRSPGRIGTPETSSGRREAAP